MQQHTKSKRSLSPMTRVSPRKRLNYDADARKMSSPTSYDEDVQLSFLTIDEEDDDEVPCTNSMEELMKLEKERYPGASSWAPAEERLFEILYMRQDLPMLPTTWDVDLRGVPISDIVFQTSDDFPPIIYAHSKDFRGMFVLILWSILLTLYSNNRPYSSHGPHSKDKDEHSEWPSEKGAAAHQTRTRQVSELGSTGRRLPAFAHCSEYPDRSGRYDNVRK